MQSRIAMVALLVLLLPGPAWAQIVAQSNAGLPQGAVDALAEQPMAIARYYAGRGDYTGAINRLKGVVMRYRSSQQIEEALARLAESYLALGINWEAQTAAAVLMREFPNSRWSALASEAVRYAGLDPLENKRSWISQAFRPAGSQ